MQISKEEEIRLDWVRQKIIDEISEQVDEVLPFDRFMDIALYSHKYGYYEKLGEIFGKLGDFTTAPEMGNLFAKCIQNEVENVLQQIRGNFYELGAGSGRLSKTILECSSRFQLDYVPNFNIIERSLNLTKVQKRLLGYDSSVTWLNELNDTQLNGFLIANELLDAMPARCFRKEEDHVTELGVALIDGELCWKPKNSVVPKYVIDQLSQKRIGHCTEFIDGLYSWLENIFKHSEQIVLIILDYGSLRKEFYHDNRRDGTIKCHYKHQLSYDPLSSPGLKDITVSIDFSLLFDYATRLGFDVLGFVSLEKLLTNLGIMEIFSEEMKKSSKDNFSLSHEAKQLLMPNEMGYAVKAIALGKNFEGNLLGFKEV